MRSGKVNWGSDGMIWTWIACQVQWDLAFDGVSGLESKILPRSSHLPLIRDSA